MKKLFSIILILFSVIVQAQNLKTTVDNSLINQGTKGITALKLRNTLNTIVDSVRLNKLSISAIQTGKEDKLPQNFFTERVYLVEDYLSTPGYPGGPASTSIHVKSWNNVDGLKNDLSIYNIDNTSDANKPVSLATQTALNGKLSLSGGTMTGNLVLNNVVKVGGSSTFENTFLGEGVLNAITSATGNVAVGKNTLKQITSGIWNTALGYKSLEIGTNSSYNAAVGSFSLQNITSGQYNTALGYKAGTNLTTGKFNTYIGTFKGTGYETSDRRIFISDGADNVRISVTSTGFVGIGTNDATSPLQIIDLPIYSSNSSAISAGLTAGAVYRSSTGFLMIVY